MMEGRRVDNDLGHDLALAVRAAEAGATVAAQAFRMAHEVVKKSGGKGLVTETDRTAEKAIVEILRRASEYAILGEESGRSGAASELCWVIDPIDGTTNFARHIPLYVVALALMRGNEILIGVTVDPTMQETYSAAAGHGAFVDGIRIGASEVSDLASAVVLLDHGYGRDDRVRFATVARRLAPIASVRSLGATALALCHVARGTADAFICSGDEIWDYAAGMRIVEEAGGRVTDWRGEPWDGTHSFILATNGKCHEYLVEAIHDLQPAPPGV